MSVSITGAGYPTGFIPLKDVHCLDEGNKIHAAKSFTSTSNPTETSSTLQSQGRGCCYRLAKIWDAFVALLIGIRNCFCCCFSNSVTEIPDSGNHLNSEVSKPNALTALNQTFSDVQKEKVTTASTPSILEQQPAPDKASAAKLIVPMPEETSVKVFNIFISNEPGKNILSKANRVINVFKDGTNQFSRKELDFQMVESLKSAKKEAKELLKNTKITSDTRKAMEQVIQQYDAIVKATEILTILKQMSQEIRKPYLDGSPILLRFSYAFQYVFNRKYNPIFKEHECKKIIVNLTTLYRSNEKDSWKKQWSIFREYMWKTSVESQSFLEQNKKIIFITGSTTASLPLIVKIPRIAPQLTTKAALIPTGKLFAHDIVPFTGEMEGGCLERGINQIALSGTKFSELDICVSYTSPEPPKNNVEEILKIKKLEPSQSYTLLRLRILVMRLLLLGKNIEDYPAIQAHIKSLIDSQPLERPIHPDALKYGYLSGKTCRAQKELTPSKEKLQRGQIVVIRKNDDFKYFMVTEKEDNNKYKLWNGEGDLYDYNVRDIYIASSNTMDKEVRMHLSHKPYTLPKFFKENFSDELRAILSLFDRISPISFSNQENELINNPFPIVWGSVSTSLPIEPFYNGVAGEHVIKGNAVLGQDIQIAFTTNENVEKLKTFLGPYHIQVLSLDAAYFLLGKEAEE